ncbi:MAG: AAA family ATPase [Bryobacteraceae bacterium]
MEKRELKPINVVIGPNGSGKSNFIGVFAFLHAIVQGRLRDYVTAAGGAEKVMHFGSKTTKEIYFHLSFEGATNAYELKLATADDGLFPSWETAFVGSEPYPDPFPHNLQRWQRGQEAGISDPRGQMWNWVRYHLEGWRIYHLHDTIASSPMRKTARVDDNEFLRADGSNLAAFLYLLKEKHNDSYALIQRTVRRVAPFFDDFQLGPRRLNPDDIKLEWLHKNSDQYFDASSLSDGTLRFIALATLFLQPEEYRPSVILVDEPELGLHPYAIEMLASLIRQASVSTQVIVATQSSLLLDHFTPEDVLVANRVEGRTQLTRLDSKQLAAWLEDYSLGQLWEKNEFGGRPVPN